MAKNDLLKEAIADAKAVRETALANAKIALEEAFTPRIQSMLSAKLSEEEGMEDEPVAEDMYSEEPAIGEEEVPADEFNEEEADATVEVEPVATEEDMDAEADLDLESILRELEEDEHAEEEEPAVTAEVSDSTDIGKGDNKMDQVSSADQDDPGKGKLSEEADEETTETKDDVSLDEIISALQEDEHDEDAPAETNETAEEKDDAKEDLEEAYNVIRFLKSKINEVNLLNAKLLFSNKLFRNHSLNESQKVKVIENFDRAQSLREVKLVFATLSESFNFGQKTKRSIKESYASKPSRSTKPKKVISEGNTLAARWKKLANL